jgi:hypothetical protein
MFQLANKEQEVHRTNQSKTSNVNGNNENVDKQLSQA